MTPQMQWLADAVNRLPIAERVELLTRLLGVVALDARSNPLAALITTMAAPGMPAIRVGVVVGLREVADEVYAFGTRRSAEMSMESSSPIGAIGAVMEGWKARVDEKERTER